jgi:hypothetical protein
VEPTKKSTVELVNGNKKVQQKGKRKEEEKVR